MNTSPGTNRPKPQLSGRSVSQNVQFSLDFSTFFWGCLQASICPKNPVCSASSAATRPTKSNGRRLMAEVQREKCQSRTCQNGSSTIANQFVFQRLKYTSAGQFQPHILCDLPCFVTQHLTTELPLDKRFRSSNLQGSRSKGSRFFNHSKLLQGFGHCAVGNKH